MIKNSQTCFKNLFKYVCPLFYCQCYEEGKDIAFDFILKTKNLNLNYGHKTENSKELFKRYFKGTLKSQSILEALSNLL